MAEATAANILCNSCSCSSPLSAVTDSTASNTPTTNSLASCSSFCNVDDKCYDVFISHAGKNGGEKNNFVAQLRAQLRRRNISFFLDEDSLETSERSAPAMIRAVATAKVVVIVLSPEYTRRVWTLRELEIALARQSEKSPQNAARFRSNETFFQFLQKRSLEEELDLIKDLDQVNGVPGDVLPIFFKMSPGQCKVKELAASNLEVKEQFFKWATEFRKEDYYGRIEAALDELRKICGPELHESQEWEDFANVVAEEAKKVPPKTVEPPRPAPSRGRPNIYKIYVHDHVRTPKDLKLVKGCELVKLKGNISLHDTYLLKRDFFSNQEC